MPLVRVRLSRFVLFSILLSCLFIGAAKPGAAATPVGQSNDFTIELRAQKLGKSLRCVVCKNQTIEDSNAPLAQELRLLLRERLSSGDSDEAVIAFISTRYGNFLFPKPPLESNSSLLWICPAILLVAISSWRPRLRQRWLMPLYALSTTLKSESPRIFGFRHSNQA